MPFIVAGAVPGETGGVRPQYQYVTDVLPTLLELCGIPHPAVAGAGGGRAMHGSSFVAVLADAAHPSTHPEQYAEMIGHRG